MYFFSSLSVCNCKRFRGKKIVSGWLKYANIKGSGWGKLAILLCSKNQLVPAIFHRCRCGFPKKYPDTYRCRLIGTFLQISSKAKLSLIYLPPKVSFSLWPEWGRLVGSSHFQNQLSKQVLLSVRIPQR